MAAQTINQALIAKVGMDLRGFNRGAGELSKTAKGIGQNVAQGLKAATVAVVAIGTAIVAATAAFGKMAQRGQQVLNVQQAFNRATGNGVAGLRLLKEATGGLISNYDLMSQANTALTLGSADTVEQFAELARTAQQLGRALGLDAAFALNSLNIGIARQSKLVLDNLGSWFPLRKRT